MVVMAAHYSSWTRSSLGDIRINSEETGYPSLVGVYTRVENCAKACYSFIDEFEVFADDCGDCEGPVESVTVYAAELGAPVGRGPHGSQGYGAGREVAKLPLSGSRAEFEKKLRKALR